ncbi:uncharacterized protein LOC134696801 isoform X3 [Mytilus trossulus]
MCKEVFQFLVLAVVSAASQKVPLLPPAYTVDFQEELHVFGQSFYSKGAWYYDFPNGRARYDHLRGQRDNFCFGQKLSDNDPHAPCSLLFTNHSSMYVYYPEAKTCCDLCGVQKGCTVLKPTWIANGSYIGDKTIQGSTCHGWTTPGFAFLDTLYATDSNVPCLYTEKSYKGNISHALTFNQASFKAGQPEETIFTIPTYCKEKCPNPFFDDIRI